MSTTQARVIGAALLFLLILASGLWLSRSGKPFGTFLLTIHKLAGLGTGILLAVTVYRIHQVAPLALLEIAAVVVTVLLFAGTVAAGALLSIDKPMPAIVSKLHHITPYLAVLSTAVALYLLLSRR